ncbi:MAG: GNAT family N-acetyltransferase [Burkholderiales bacterium]|nr:GNAT family N-acetyltransferase [Burkholderiales bacterium]
MNSPMSSPLPSVSPTTLGARTGARASDRDPFPPGVARELEANECTAYRSLFEVGSALFGDTAFEVESGDGVTAFVSPLVRKPGVFNRVLGLGLAAPPRAADLVGLAEHFRRAGCVPAFELPPPQLDTAAAEALRALRMRRVATAAVLQRRLDRESARTGRERPDNLQVLKARGEACRAAATICAEVFGMPATVLSVLEALQDQPGWQLWLALLDGQPAGAALSHTHGARCWFGWAATLPACRGRGVKGALDEVRMAAAEAAGCTLISSDTATGTPAAPDHSLRSLLRSGFTATYLRGTYLQQVPVGRP